MNEILLERIRRKLETLGDEQAYQVLDYVEFLESKYAERQAPANAFQKVAEKLEDTLRAGKVPVTIIKGTMDAVATAGKFLEGLAAAGKAVVDEATKKKERAAGEAAGATGAAGPERPVEQQDPPA